MEVDAGAAAQQLTMLGCGIAASDLTLEARSGRWLARLPGDRIAWFAATDAGHATMARERRVLRLLEDRVGFPLPVVLVEAPDGSVDVRTLVVGLHDPDAIERRADEDERTAAELGASIGAVLASLHRAVRSEEVRDWLPAHPSWPRASSEVLVRLAAVVDDPALRHDAGMVLQAYEDAQQSLADTARVLAHGDFGFHNCVVGHDPMRVTGVFDFGSALWGDPHTDFRYLEPSLDHWELLDAALTSYVEAGGQPLSRSRILLHGAASAVGYLAARAGTAPDERPCGRTLEEDLRWTRRAVARSVLRLAATGGPI